MRNERLYRMIMVAMLGSMAFLLMWLGQVPVPLFADFLRYDPGDVPGMIAAYTLGPAPAVAVQALKSVLFFISGKSSAGWVGVLANFLAGVALVVPAGMLHFTLQKAGAKAWAWGLLSAAVGTLIMTAVLIPLNALLVYPLWGMEGAAAWNGAIAISTPFNLFKGFLSSVMSVALYRYLEPFLAGRVFRQKAA